jgi:predicted nuclease of predicted toxin-antitoxin system
VRILLDENFPLQLHRRLLASGHEAEHIIPLGLRGVADADIRRRLATEADLLFLTHDTEFAELAPSAPSTVMISRVPQALPIARRVELWTTAIEGFLRDPLPGNLFEILPDGAVVAWRTLEQ